MLRPATKRSPSTPGRSGPKSQVPAQPGNQAMITLCIRYTLDPHKLADFEAYARALGPQIERCGGKAAGYYLPTTLAGPTYTALGLIDFANLAASEEYREE